jgi:polyhydroxybutyrate depolymerase
LLYIVGTADPLNPIEGGEIHLGRQPFGTKPPIREMIGTWLDLHNCRTKPRIVYEKGGDSGLAYGRSGEDAVVIYALNGHGHHWPGGRSLLPKEWAGMNVAKLQATDVIWEFFKTKTNIEYNPP